MITGVLFHFLKIKIMLITPGKELVDYSFFLSPWSISSEDRGTQKYINNASYVIHILPPMSLLNGLMLWDRKKKLEEKNLGIQSKRFHLC